MPMVSQSQNRFFRWAATHPAEAKRERGLKPGVAEDFINASHGEQITKLPERKATGGEVELPRRFKW